jgi:hypothetical protein
MLRTPRFYEKNWMPITGSREAIKFLYRPGHVVDDRGQDLGEIRVPRLRTDSFAGSSQLIPWFTGGYLGIVHEAHVYMDAPHKRYYSHRFTYYSDDFRLLRVSRPFFLKDRVIEFVAGMCMHPEGNDVVISFGFKDCEAWLARVPRLEVWRFVCQGREEPR